MLFAHAPVLGLIRASMIHSCGCALYCVACRAQDYNSYYGSGVSRCGPADVVICVARRVPSRSDDEPPWCGARAEALWRGGAGLCL